jgi:hypothetical protein
VIWSPVFVFDCHRDFYFFAVSSSYKVNEHPFVCHTRILGAGGHSHPALQVFCGPRNMFSCLLVGQEGERKQKKRKKKTTLFFVSLTLFNILLVFVCLEVFFLYHLLHLTPPHPVAPNPPKRQKKLLSIILFSSFSLSFQEHTCFEYLKVGHHTLTLT